MEAWNNGLKASLEFVDLMTSGPCRVYARGTLARPGGYLSKNGGFTQRLDKAQVFNGPGVAIQYARAVGLAILSW